MIAENPIMSFQMFRVAQEKYDAVPDSLEQAQLEDAKRIAQRKIRIEEAVLSSSEAAGVAVAAKQVDAAFGEIQKRYESDDDFIEDLKLASLDKDAFYQSLSRELHVEAVLDFVSTGCEPVSETEASLFYYMNVEKFEQAETRTARHILVTINDESAENNRELALKKISQIETRLRKKINRFDEQALKHSECPTSLQGGLLGQVQPGVLYPEIEQVLFKLKIGELSSVVESPLGFHLLRCEEIVEKGVTPFEQIKDKLCASLEQRKRKQVQRQWLETALKAHAQVCYATENVANEETANG